MRRFSILFLMAIAQLTASQASANLVLPLDEQSYFEVSSKNSEYQLGDEWGKHPITKQELENGTRAFRRAAYATVKLGGGTGFYLGVFNGEHVVATNHHVCPAGFNCLSEKAIFPLLNLSFKFKRFLGTWKNVDLSLLTIDVKTKDAADKLAPVAGNFAFNSDIYQNQELITIGFGIANNSSREIVANYDSDCKVFSRKNEFKLMADPDDVNPGDYKAWSFSNGCDVSHGDSGSAMIDRATGEVVGLIWTGKIPKNPKVQSSAYLQEILNQQSEEVWKELSYAVPASKIKGAIEATIEKPSLDPEVKKIFQDLVD